MSKLQRIPNLFTSSAPEFRWLAADEVAGPWDLRPVAADEMGFAMEFFVGFARGRCTSSEKDEASSKEGMAGRAGLQTADELLLQSLCEADGETGLASRPGERTLDLAFRALCDEYRHSEAKHSICARVLGFHLLMQRTKGSVMERWMTACEGQPEVIQLHWAVVRALGCVELCRRGRLPVREFLELTERLAAEG